jgi:hypothetical protein
VKNGAISSRSWAAISSSRSTARLDRRDPRLLCVTRKRASRRGVHLDAADVPPGRAQREARTRREAGARTAHSARRRDSGRGTCRGCQAGKPSARLDRPEKPWS